MKSMGQCEQEVLAAVGKFLISKLEGRDDLARAIFDALYPQFKDRYPHHKVLSQTVLAYVKEEDDSQEDVIARLQGRPRPFPNFPEKF